MSGKPKDQAPLAGETAIQPAQSHMAEQALETLAQISPMGIFRTDAQGNCTYVSERWCEIAGIMAADALGTGWAQAIHADDREQVTSAWYAAARDRKNFSMECRFQLPDGTIRWVLGQAMAEEDSAGGLVGHIGTVIDITAQRQTEAALHSREAEFKTLVQNIPGTVYRCALDEHWTVMFVSDHIETLSGYPLADFIDNRVRSYASIIHPDDAARVDLEARAGVARHAPYTLEYRIIHADGKVRWVLEKGQASFDGQGNVAWLDGVITDITERKLANEKIQQHSEKLAALLKVSQEFTATLDLHEVLQTITDRVTELSGFKNAAIYLLEDETLRLWATTPPLPLQFPEELRNAPLADHPHIHQAITTRQPVFMADTATTALTAAEQSVTELRGLRSILYLPLLVDTRVLGILIVTSVGAPQPISEAQIDLALPLANIAALAVENAQLYQSSQHYAADLEQKISEYKVVENALRDSESRYRELFQANPHPMWVFDLETLRFLAVNDAAVDHYGYSQDAFLAMTIEDIRPPEDIPRLRKNLAHPVETGIDNAGVWRHLKQDGTLIDVVISSHKIEFDGRDAELVLAYDITERKQAEARIQQLAHFDSLTGLPNRTLLHDRINQAISMAHRNNQTLALIFIDLDHFKHINDTLGHRIGDLLLIEVAKRLQTTMREEDTVARFGGDEFILLLPGINTDGAARVVEKLLEIISQHYLIEQHELLITPSIGIALYPADGKDFNSLSMSADIAMYRAKRDGRNNYRFFTSEMQTRSIHKLMLRSALLRALERDQLLLHYQPQIDLASGRIIGAEALLRWQHHELGPVSPAEFIPLAEDSGAIITIGEWVLRSAVRQLKAWMESGLPPMNISVNLSAVQFRHAHLPELVSQILHQEGLSPEYLELELTEGVAMDNPLNAVAVMDDLHQRGVYMSIDDFGTGYSSLSQLKRFHVYRLKIDRSFVSDIAEDPEDKAIVRAIINMAKGLGLKTIAEGVETKEQLEFLLENGCDEMQGYYFSKPLPAEQFEAFVSSRSE